MSRCSLVVVLGQSNASGSATDHDPDGLDARDPRILTFPATGPDAGTIVPAREPLAPLGGHPPGGMGPGGPFASLLLPTLPPDATILIVPAAMGGTGFRRHGGYPGLWKVGHQVDGVPRLFDLAVAHVRAALAAAGPGSDIAAVLWYQGESDGGRPAAEYAADLDELVGAFRAAVPEAAEVPYLVGGLAAERLATYPDHAGVQQALETIAERVPLTAFAPAPPPGHMIDGITHFDAGGQRLLGASYFGAYLELARGQQPDGDQPLGDDPRHCARA